MALDYPLFGEAKQTIDAQWLVERALAIPEGECVVVPVEQWYALARAVPDIYHVPGTAYYPPSFWFLNRRVVTPSLGGYTPYTPPETPKPIVRWWQRWRVGA